MLAIHHGSIVSQGKHRGFEEQQEGYAAYCHRFEVQSTKVPLTFEQYKHTYKMFTQF